MGRLIKSLSRPRIHTGLIDMGRASRRMYCGVGFVTDATPTVWEVRPSSNLRLDGIDSIDQDGRADIQAVAEALNKLFKGVGFEATLVTAPVQHAGFGTKTTLVMGLIAAVNHLNGSSLTTLQMQTLSGRGGASGIGIHGFFHGGIIWDGGHSPDMAESFLPSGKQVPLRIPPLLGRWPFPVAWRIALLLPDERILTPEEEEDFFLRSTPIPAREIEASITLVYHGLVPAFVTSDFSLLRETLRDLQGIGFKSREIAAQSERAKELIAKLASSKLVAAGMSSLGPLIYAIFPKDAEPETTRALSKIADESDISYLGNFDGWNSPYQLIEMPT